MAPVVRALAAAGPALVPIVCVTAQHRDLADQVLSVFGLTPDYDLDVMRADQNPSAVVATLLERVGTLLKDVRPDLVVVQGDTATAMASALAAYFEQIPVAHVEAGLRTGQRYDPFPEEILRRLITPIAAIHLAATTDAAERLLAEGVQADEIYVTGNPVVDALIEMRSRVRPFATTAGRRLVLVTAHRRENFGEPLRRICDALAEIAESHPDIEVVYPVHPNPEVDGPVRRMLGSRDRIRLVRPLAYDEFIGLLDRAVLAISDSGGLQEEAPVLGTPLLILRNTTERPEAVEAGAAILVGSDPKRIVAEANRLLGDPAAHASMSQAQSPFGDGRAAKRIAAIVLQAVAGQGHGADEFRYVRVHTPR